MTTNNKTLKNEIETWRYSILTGENSNDYE